MEEVGVMEEVGWYLKRVAVPLFLGALVALSLTLLLWNHDWVIYLGAAVVVVSLAAAILYLMKSPYYASWSLITSGIMVAVAVLVSASFTQTPGKWLANFPAWAIGPVFWALLRECRKDESGINLMSWSIFIAIDTIALGFIVGRVGT